MRISENLLPYNNLLKLRDPASITLAVIHCTELPDIKVAREFGERILYPESGTGVSGHYYIDRDGSITRYVQDDRVAHHVIGHNDHSIGIELVNSGRFPLWYNSHHQTVTDPYPELQIHALKQLLSELKSRYPQLSKIARHSDLDTVQIPADDDPDILISRKIDPGPLFPWEQLLQWWNEISSKFRI